MGLGSISSGTAPGQRWTNPSVMLSPYATNFVTESCGGVDGTSGARLTGALRHAFSARIAIRTRKRSVFKALLDDGKKSVGNFRVAGFGRVQSVRADEIARGSPKRLKEIHEWDALAGGHGSDLIVRRNHAVCTKATTGAADAERTLWQQVADECLHPPA